jgi:hypothetical protein
MALLPRLQSDPDLRVRLHVTGPPALWRDCRLFETLRSGDVVGLPQDKAFALVAEGGHGMSAWREYGLASAAVPVLDGNAPTAGDARRGARLDSLAVGSSAGYALGLDDEDEGPSDDELLEDESVASEPTTVTAAADVEERTSVTLPALGSELTQNALLDRLRTSKSSRVGKRILAEGTSRLVDPDNHRAGRLYTVDAQLVAIVEAEGYAVTHESAPIGENPSERVSKESISDQEPAESDQNGRSDKGEGSHSDPKATDWDGEMDEVEASVFAAHPAADVPDRNNGMDPDMVQPESGMLPEPNEEIPNWVGDESITDEEWTEVRDLFLDAVEEPAVEHAGDGAAPAVDYLDQWTRRDADVASADAPVVTTEQTAHPSFHLPRGVKVEAVSVRLFQEGTDDDEVITLRTEDHGAGPFAVIETERWSLDDPSDLTALLGHLLDLATPEGVPS